MVAILLLCAAPVRIALAQGAQDRITPTSPSSEVVQNGTRFLVRLEQEIRTGTAKVNAPFEVQTIEPLGTSRGHVIRSGARIVGHISRIEPGGLTGHARLWLTFDDIDTQHGMLPIVAEVASVPGEYSVRQGESKEGEIEARTIKGTELVEAAAVGAAKGGAAGVVSHNAKAAATGAATGGVLSFVAASGIGQEIDLPKGTKLELVLERPLYLNQ
jgi:hypothetical protein